MEKKDSKEVPTFESEGDLHDEIEAIIKRINEDITDGDPASRYLVGMNDMFRFFHETYLKNIKLLEKAQEQSAAVVLNASKIKAILNLTESDKSSLQKLKTEYEEAATIVNHAHASELKSKEIIVQLRNNISELKAQVDKGEAFSFGGENPILEVSQDVKNLKIEKAKAQDDINTLESTISAEQGSLDKCQNEIKTITNESNRISEQLDFVQTQVNNLEEIVNDTSERILNLKPEILEMKTRFEAGKTNKVRKQKSNQQLRSEHYERLSELTALRDENKNYKEKLTRRGKHLSEIKNKINLRQEEIANDKQEMALAENECAELKQKFKQTCAENENLQIKYDEIVNESKELGSEKGLVRKEARQMRSELITVSFAMSKSSNENQQESRKVGALKLSVNLEKKKVSEEKLITKDTSDQAKTMKSETLNFKADLQGLKEKILLLFDEVDKERSNTFQTEARAQMMTEINAQTIEMLNAHQHELESYKDKHEHQTQLSDKLRQERNVYKRNLMSVLAENDNIRDEMGRLEEEMRMMRSDGSSLLHKIIDEHVQRRLLKTENDRLAMQAAKCKEGALATERIISRLYAEVQTLSYILNEAKNDHIQQQKEKHLLESNIECTHQSIHDRDTKIAQLHSDIITMTNNIAKCRTVYNEKIHQMMDQTSELEALQEKTSKLEEKLDHLHQCQFELHRTSTELMFERQKRSALVHEFSVPRNVHRWDAIEAVDPTYAKNLRYRAEITAKIDVAHRELIELQKEKRILSTKLAEMNEKCEKASTKAQVENAIRKYTEALRQKERAIAEMKAAIAGNINDLGRSVSSIDTIRQRLNDRRGKTALLRSRTALASIEERQKREDETWFLTEAADAVPPTVGGGFVCKTPQARATVTIGNLAVDGPTMAREGKARPRPSPLMTPQGKRITRPVTFSLPLNKL